MINIRKNFKNCGPLESLVSVLVFYAVVMLMWTAITRNGVLEKANDIKSNHKNVVELINNEINECSQNIQNKTSWGEDCNSTWTSSTIIEYILNNVKLKNPYSLSKPLVSSSPDPRIDAEGKAGQSTNKGVIFVSSNNFSAVAGSEWIVGTCIK